MRKIELLSEIKRKLDEARHLAIEAGGFTLFYFIGMALFETKETAENIKLSESEDKSLGASLSVTSQVPGVFLKLCGRRAGRSATSGLARVRCLRDRTSRA